MTNTLFMTRRVIPKTWQQNSCAQIKVRKLPQSSKRREAETCVIDSTFSQSQHTLACFRKHTRVWSFTSTVQRQQRCDKKHRFCDTLIQYLPWGVISGWSGQAEFVSGRLVTLASYRMTFNQLAVARPSLSFCH